jgi:hypothetical protein
VVFLMFAAFALLGGMVTLGFAVETRGLVLEELSPSAGNKTSAPA